ncbi:keratin [Agrobacterium rhizogenes]|uniref:hypothetical protein n=1 Tax=Rhizobium rhizogenes TaxID=359 RepID=UPI001574878B|nr:hypothetical protein [Rhizobium rhizogenes]NTI16098.1 keratin [Rhizobium rhizogenes]
MPAAVKEPQKNPTQETSAAIDRDIAAFEQRRDEIRAQIDRLGVEARQVELNLKHLRDAKRSLSLIDVNHPEGPSHIDELPTAPEDFAKRRIERPKTQTWQVRQQAYRILKDQGHPLSRNEIFERLTALGVQIDHPTPAIRVGRILTDTEEFEYRDNGYWIAGEPITVPVSRPKRFRTRRKPKEM